MALDIFYFGGCPMNFLRWNSPTNTFFFSYYDTKTDKFSINCVSEILWHILSAFEIRFKWLALKLTFMIGNWFRYHLQRWSLKLKRFACFEEHNFTRMFSHISFPPRFEFLFWWYDLNLLFMVFSQRAEFYKSCFTWWLFLYHLWRSTLKIMIKVPMNLIRQNHTWRCRNWMTQLYVLHLNVDKVLTALCQDLWHICLQQ